MEHGKHMMKEKQMKKIGSRMKEVGKKFVKAKKKKK